MAVIIHLTLQSLFLLLLQIPENTGQGVEIVLCALDAAQVISGKGETYPKP